MVGKELKRRSSTKARFTPLGLSYLGGGIGLAI
mgnify:CR=1 FL=1